MNQELLSEKELADRYGLHVRTLNNWRAAGIGPKWIVIGKNTIRYRMEDVIAYEKGCVQDDKDEAK